MKVRNAGFREQFRKKDLSKLAFRKVRGYKFVKVDKEHEGRGWALIKDDTSSRILRLIYTDLKTYVYHPKPKLLLNILDLEAALPVVREMWEDPNFPKRDVKWKKVRHKHRTIEVQESPVQNLLYQTGTYDDSKAIKKNYNSTKFKK